VELLGAEKARRPYVWRPKKTWKLDETGGFTGENGGLTWCI